MTEEETKIFNTFTEDFRLFLLEQFNTFAQKRDLSISDKTKQQLHELNAISLLKCFIYNNARNPFGKKQVVMSKELLKSPYYKLCQRMIKTIKDLFLQGKSITKYLSKTTSDLSFDDGLLNDWGIIHLHLFPECTRGILGNFLLFVYQYENTVFFLDIGKHYFKDKHLLEIIDNNWDDVLPTLDMGNTNRSFTDLEIKALRKNHVCYSLTINDKTFMTQLHPLAREKMTIPTMIFTLFEELAQIYCSEKSLFQNNIISHGGIGQNIDIHIGFDSSKVLICLYDKISTIGFTITNINHMELLKNLFYRCGIFT